MFVGAPEQKRVILCYFLRRKTDSVAKVCEGHSTSITPSRGQSLFQLLSEPLIGPNGLLQTLTETPHLPQVLLYQIYP